MSRKGPPLKFFKKATKRQIRKLQGKGFLPTKRVQNINKHFVDRSRFAIATTQHRVGAYATKYGNSALDWLSSSNKKSKYQIYRVCSNLLHYSKHSCKCKVHFLEQVIGVFSKYLRFTYSRVPWWIHQGSLSSRYPCRVYGWRS